MYFEGHYFLVVDFPAKCKMYLREICLVASNAYKEFIWSVGKSASVLTVVLFLGPIEFSPTHLLVLHFSWVLLRTL